MPAMFTLEEPEANFILIVDPEATVLAKKQGAGLLLTPHLDRESFRQRAHQEEPSDQDEQRDAHLSVAVERGNQLHDPLPGEQGAFV